MNILYTVGKSAVDDHLSKTIHQYELTFSNRIRGYYLLGSYADGCAVVGSDIDMYILFKEMFLTPDEAVQAQQLALTCAQMSTPRLEIKIGCEQSLVDEHSIVRVALKRNSALLYGEDTRTTMVLPTKEAYRRDVTDGVLDFLFRLHPHAVITYPLTYPDSQGTFYGYDHLTQLPYHVAAVYHTPDNAKAVYYATRELVECACRMATALPALKTESVVGTKRESVQIYRAIINDGWTPFLIAIFEQGKMQWRYGFPEGEGERAELRMLCEQMLAFEKIIICFTIVAICLYSCKVSMKRLCTLRCSDLAWCSMMTKR